MRLNYIVLLVFSFVSLLGCGPETQQRVQIDLASQPVIFADEWVKRMPPMVQVSPIEPIDRPISVLFVPFRVTQSMQHADELGYGIASSVWQTWLADQTFDTIEFSRGSQPYRRDLAIQEARSKGADLVVGGFITHYFAGGNNADSRVSMIIEIHDARNGVLIWSLAQTGIIPKQTFNDYLLFAVKTRLPSDPVFAIVSTMAQDMSTLIKTWRGKGGGSSEDKMPFSGRSVGSQPSFSGEQNNGASNRGSSF
ncbi:hypothetical protein [Desulfovibrio litoralis]|uniref:Lipoprotein n=1 Tax=Desulfovibrio litoralis DSM 11393 TaxID=1121455 RepID=A0A1M7SA91_9BACT|nr:hypothetical protein [Desulfovibrio litoralis]SHN55192.1 hypothetical protein SAMN02745728_00643 [Desulfovibrio litoralis DSM 11393]